MKQGTVYYCGRCRTFHGRKAGDEGYFKQESKRPIGGKNGGIMTCSVCKRAKAEVTRKRVGYVNPMAIARKLRGLDRQYDKVNKIKKGFKSAPVLVLARIERLAMKYQSRLGGVA